MKKISSIKDYSTWVDSVWFSKMPGSETNNDISVMTLGLVGEVAEVIEECINFRISNIDLKKEIGDVLYYITRICNFFELNAPEIFNSGIKNSFLINENGKNNTLLHISKNAGLAADCIKKFLRDDNLNKNLLKEKIINVIAYLFFLIEFYDFDFFDIVNTNIEKIENRKKNN
jgi:NTP pyrophosphatase (non-canonical NTP hydrolase)